METKEDPETEDPSQVLIVLHMKIGTLHLKMPAQTGFSELPEDPGKLGTSRFYAAMPTPCPPAPRQPTEVSTEAG
jgi:hypothetical protein